MDKGDGNQDGKAGDCGDSQRFKPGFLGYVKRMSDSGDLLVHVKYKKDSEFSEYQHECARTASHSDLDSFRVATSALGLSGESGEVADMLKKYLAHGHDLEREELVKELGDVLWYLTDIATMFGISLKEVADKNIIKLKKRYPNGFSQSDSINRKE